jgi:2,5-diamino-6-(ribosylamino)-4(3H)-pyrimidinone 5'-phosphate reductase
MNAPPPRSAPTPGS